MLNLIASRRSRGCHPELPVARADVQALLQAGCWAPNHKKSEPWRFIVFQGDGRKKLQAAWVAHAQAAGKNTDAIAAKAFRAPVIITVWCAAGRGDKPVPLWEEEAAVAACCQNMLLAAESLGLAAIWRTGAVEDMPEVHALLPGFNAAQGDRIMGFLYIGQPDPAHAKPVRPTPVFEDKTVWVEEG